jgi:hypothetical protein
MVGKSQVSDIDQEPASVTSQFSVCQSLLKLLERFVIENALGSDLEREWLVEYEYA